MQLAECFATKKFIASLDYAKAFDHTRLHLACQTLQWLGCPFRLVEGILRLWGNQVRHISWNHSILSRPQQVGSSMPQGDSLSPRVLNLILAMPMRAVMRAEPDTQMVVFVDDGSWGSDTLRSLKSVVEQWRRHSSWLGFKENISESQFTHADSSQRSRMEQDEDLKDHVTPNLWALGDAMGFGSIPPKEEARISKARNAASKIRVAVVSAGVRAFIASAAASAKATCGWLWCVSQLQRTGRNWRLSCAGWDFAIEWQVRVSFVWSLVTHKMLNCKQAQRQSWQFGVYVSTKLVCCGIGWSLRDLLPVSKLGCPHLVGLLRNLGIGLTMPCGFGCLLTQVLMFGAMVGIMLLISLVKRGDIFGGRNIWSQGAMKLMNFLGTLSDLKWWLCAQSKGASKHVVAVLTGAFVSPECRNRQDEGAEEKCPWCSVSMASSLACCCVSTSVLGPPIRRASPGDTGATLLQPWNSSALTAQCSCSRGSPQQLWSHDFAPQCPCSGNGGWKICSATLAVPMFTSEFSACSISNLVLPVKPQSLLDVRLWLNFGLATIALIGECMCFLIRCFLQWFFRKRAKQIVDGSCRFRRVRSPTWNNLCVSSGPWRQACSMFQHGPMRPARRVKETRVEGMHGAGGMHTLWRRSALRCMSCHDK